MKIFRLVPKIDVKNHQLVKGVRFEGLRVLGAPEEFAFKYYNDGADEIIYHDVIASLLGRSALYDLVSNTAKKIFIPLTVSGGIRNLNDIYKMLKSGADRIAINSHAHQNPGFIKEAVKEFGSSTIVISLDVALVDGKYKLTYENGKNIHEQNIFDWINLMQDSGVGEFSISAVHKDGTKTGFDLNLLKILDNKIKIPFIFGSGIGQLSHLDDLKKYKNLKGIILSSILHYNYISSNYSDDSGNTEYIKENFDNKSKKIKLSAIKTHLASRGLICR